jgi:ubiquinone/menaquinone biosynthesis C-methylase UbiE
MGPSANPDIRATDAVDYDDKKGVARYGKMVIKPEYKWEVREGKLKLPKPQTNNKIKILYNINYMKDILPYSDNSIDVIVSYHSLNTLNNISNNTKEIYRILKPGGHIDIGFDMPKNYIGKDIAIELIKNTPIVTPIKLERFVEKSNKKYKEGMKYYKNLVDHISKYLKNSGFKNVKVIKNAKDCTLYKYQLKDKFLTVVRAYK